MIIQYQKVTNVYTKIEKAPKNYEFIYKIYKYVQGSGQGSQVQALRNTSTAIEITIFTIIPRQSTLNGHPQKRPMKNGFIFVNPIVVHSIH